MRELNERGSFATRVMDDGRVVDIVPIFGGKVRLCVSRDVRDLGYDEVF